MKKRNVSAVEALNRQVRTVHAFQRRDASIRRRLPVPSLANLLTSTAMLTVLLTVAQPDGAQAQDYTGGNGNTGSGAPNWFTGGGGGGGGGSGDGSSTAAVGNPGQNGGSGNRGGVGGASDRGGGGGLGYYQAAGGGGGGSGGAGFSLTGTLTNVDQIMGGRGGNGGNGTVLSGSTTSFAGGAGGGGGGSGVFVTTGTSLSNSGLIQGGNGGNGSFATTPFGYNGPALNALAHGGGGEGGHGINGDSAVGVTINNSGTIQGGNGGLRASDSAGSVGGLGIQGQNLTINNSGAILGGFRGGAVGVESARQAGIFFTGGDNSLTNTAGTVGNIVSIGNTDLNISGGTVGNIEFHFATQNSLHKTGGTVGAIMTNDHTTTDISGVFSNTLTNNGNGIINITGGDATGFTLFGNVGTLNIGDGRTFGAESINNFGTAQINVGQGATLNGTGNTLNNNATINVATDGSVTDAGDINNNATGIINFNGPGGTATLDSGTGNITNAGQINVNGGDVDVSGNITNGGTVALTGGDMAGVGAFTNQATGTVNVTTGNTLSVDTFTSTAGGAVTGTGTISAETGITLGAGSYSTGFAGNAGLTTSGGTVTFSGNSTYSGVTELTDGSIRGGATNAFSANSEFDIATDATLDLGGFDQTIAGISGDGTVTNNGSTGATLLVGDAGDYEFSGIIQDGSAQTGLNKRGMGTLTLTGENTYTRGTTVTNGTLRIGDGGTSGSVAGALFLNNASRLVVDRSDALTMSNTIFGDGSLEMTGGGTLTLTGSNSHQAGTTISGRSTIAITDAASLGDPDGGLTFDDGTLQLGGSNLTIAHGVQIDAGGGTFRTVGNFSHTLSGDISGSGDLNLTGTGALVLGGNNTHDGDTNISHSNLFVVGGNAIGDLSAVNVAYLSSLLLNDSETIGSLAGSGTVEANAHNVTLTTGGNDDSTTFSGMLTQGYGALSLVKTGAGTLILSGASNDYTGGTTIEEGAIGISSDANLGAAPGALTLGGAATSGRLIVTESFGSDRDITIEAGGGALDVAADRTWTNAGDIAGPGDLEKLGGGTLVLTGDNSGHSGDLAISAGVLQVGNGTGAGAFGTGDVAIDTGAMLRVNHSGTVGISGDISGDGALETIGAGTLILSGNNSYTGGTTLDGGTIRVESDTALGTGNLLVLGSTLDIAGGTTIGNDFDLDDDLTINVDGGTGTHTGVIADNPGGSGGIEKTGAGTLVLTGTNTYSGATTISEGIVSITRRENISDNSAELRFAGGELRAADSITLVKDYSVEAGESATISAVTDKFIRLETSSGGQFRAADGSQVRFGNADGGEGVVHLTPGAAVFGNDVDVFIDAGRVRAYGADFFSTNDVEVFLGAAGTLDLANDDLTVQDLQDGVGGGGRIINDGVFQRTLTLRNANDTAFSGTIEDGATGIALAKTGTGTLTLSGASTFSGGTTLAEGTIVVGNDDALGTGAVAAAGGRLVFEDGRTFGNDIDLRDDLELAVNDNDFARMTGDIGETGGSFGITKTGEGALGLAGAAYHTGDTRVEEGTLAALGDAALSRFSAHVVEQGARLVIGPDVWATVGSLAGEGDVALDPFGLGTDPAGTRLSIGTDGTDNIFSGIISGNGELLTLGDGSLTLTGGSVVGGVRTGSALTRGLTLGGDDGHVLEIAGDGVLEVGTLGGGAGLVDIEQGLLRVSGGGLFLNGDASGGVFVGDRMEIAGSGSAARVDGSVFLMASGFAAAAPQLTVSAGGRLEAGTLFVSEGVATVSGAGSTASVADTLYIGCGCMTGEVVVADGGVLDVATGADFVIEQQGVLRIGTGGLAGTVNAGLIENGGAIIADFTDATTLSGGISDYFDTFFATNLAGSLLKTGTGVLHLSGVNTYTGATVVDGGILHVAAGGSIAKSAATVSGGGLVVNGTAGAVNVAGGGFLGGAGTVGVTKVGSGGFLSPGNSIGTITVNGGLTFAKGSTYVVEVSPKAADRTNVKAVGGAGKANLAGATVVAVYGPGKYVAKKYVIVDAQGGIVGKFEGLNGSAPAGTTHRLAYDAKRAWLELELAMASGRGQFSGLSWNQQQVADALDAYFKKHGQLPASLAALSKAGLTIVSGEVGAGAQAAGMAGSERFLDTLGGPLFDDGGAGAGSGGGATAYAAERPSPASERFARMSYGSEELAGGTDAGTRAMRLQHRLEAGFADASAASRPERYSVWGAALGGGFSLPGDAATGSQAIAGSVYGLASGFDWIGRSDTGLTRAGFALGGSFSNATIAGLGTASTGTVSAGIRASHDFGNLYLTGTAAYGLGFVTTSRRVGAETYSAAFAGHGFSGRAEAGWRFRTKAVDIAPFVAARALSFSTPAYTETGSGAGTFALAYQPNTALDARSELGIRLNRTIAHASGGRTGLTAMAGWAHHFARANRATAGFAALPGTSFATQAATGATNTALVSLGVSHTFATGLGISLDADGEFGQGTTQYGAKAKLKFAW